ncbi:uncharacterized protein TNCV_740061 [Trichonephila clavipes]|nr:uncharacterized protein TNCV_740061 [Trichonephila clavipes]
MDNNLISAKCLSGGLEISFKPPRRIRRKHIFGDGSKDVHLSYEDDLRQTIFSSIDRVTAEIRERFQQLQNLAQKYAFLRFEVMLSVDELNLDQAPQDINKELQLDTRVIGYLATPLVKATDSWPAGHELEPSNAEDLTYGKEIDAR